MAWNTPRTWVADELVVAQYGNDWGDDADYLKGFQAQTGDQTITLAANAAAGATSIDVTELEEEVPNDAVIQFAGQGRSARTIAATPASDGDPTSIPVEALPAALVDGETASYPGQQASDLQVALEVTDGIGWQVTQARGAVAHQQSSGTSLFRLLAQHATAMADGDYCDLRFGLRKTDGTTELYAVIRAFRDGTNVRASIYIYTFKAGAMNAAPAIVIHNSGTWGIGGSPTGGYHCDITGDVDVDEAYIGLALWREVVAGTAYHGGDAEITGQFISTVATGTAPFSFGSGAGLVKNLNADNLKSKTWPTSTRPASGSVTVNASATEFTVASTTFNEAGLWEVWWEMTITVAALDAGATWTGIAPGSPLAPALRSPTAGYLLQMGGTGQYTATNGEALTLEVSRNAGTGTTSSAAGSLLARRIG